MERRPATGEERSPREHDPLLDGAEVPEETSTEDVIPDDLGRDDRPPPDTQPEEPLP